MSFGWGTNLTNDFEGCAPTETDGLDADLAGLQGHRGQRPAGGEALRQSRPRRPATRRRSSAICGFSARRTAWSSWSRCEGRPASPSMAVGWLSSFAPPSVLPDISPTRGEIGLHRRLRQSPTLQGKAPAAKLPISPLVGEMSGRTEGGAVERRAEVARLCRYSPSLSHSSPPPPSPTPPTVATSCSSPPATTSPAARSPSPSASSCWPCCRRTRSTASGAGACRFSPSTTARAPPSACISFAGFAVLIAAGLFGSRDPLSNPLPLVIWTLLWVGLALLQGVFGDLWSWLNPWYGPWRLVLAPVSAQR